VTQDPAGKRFGIGLLYSLAVVTDHAGCVHGFSSCVQFRTTCKSWSDTCASG
jgi:hypothetical protein